MDNGELYLRLTSVFHAVFDDEEIVLTPELSASEIEDWDSLRHVRLILNVEKAFGISFSAAEVGRLTNVGDLATLISSKVA